MVHFKTKFIQVLAWVMPGLVLGVVSALSSAMFAILIISVVVGISLWFFSNKDERRFITGIYFVALAIRIIATLFLVTTMYFEPSRPDNSGALSGDEHVYWRRAQEISRLGINDIQNMKVATSFDRSQSAFGLNFISIISSIFYSTFGFSLLAMKILSCIMGALSVVIIYCIARGLFNRKIAKISCILAAFYPSLIHWSAQVIKEPFVIFLILLIFLLILRINLKRWYLSSGILLSILVLYSLQPYPVFILFFSFAALFLWWVFFKKASLIRISLFAICIFILAAYILRNDNPQNRIRDILLEIRYHSSWQTLTGKSGYMLYPLRSDINKSMPDISNVSDYFQELKKYNLFSSTFLITYLRAYFLGLFYVIFSPFPWSVSTALQLEAYPQVILNYFILPFVALGILLCIRYKLKETSLVLLFYFSIISLLAISEGNVGGMFRHRDWITPFSLMFAGVGLVKIFWPSQMLSFKGSNGSNQL